MTAIRIPSHTLIRSEGDKVALIGMVAAAAACYTWRVPGAPEGYYLVAPHRLAGLRSPAEMLSAARGGHVYDYPHITDVMTRYPVVWLAEVQAINLHQIASMMTSDGCTLISARKEFPERLDIGLPVSACLTGEGHISVCRYTLKEVLASLPVGKARIGLIVREEYKALCISVDGDPNAVYYLPQHGDGLSAFIH